MDHLKGRVAVVTGSSAGIGEALAIKLVKAGLIVVGIARRILRLQNRVNERYAVDVANKAHFGTKTLQKKMEESNLIGQFIPLGCDLTDENDILKAFKWIDENIGGIHFLINNAGIVRFSPILSGCSENWQEIIDCNILAPTICSREAYKLMKKHNVIQGHIIQINSLTGHSFSVNPGNKMYNASKQALRVLTEGLRHELAAAGDGHIKASSISPGFVDTEIFEAAKIPHVKLNPTLTLSSEEMADMIAFVMSTGPNILIAEMIVLSQGRTIQTYASSK